MNKPRTIFILSFTLAWMGSCNSGPEPIAFGKDQCAFCKMTISDRKFGAELITEKGRILKYDAAECLINHLEEDAPPYHELWAIAHDHPGELYPVDSLSFIISPEYRSPMGANLAGFIKSAYPAEGMRWAEVRGKLSH